MDARGAMNFQPRITRMGTDKTEGREAQGCAWASQAEMDFQIPSQASLHGILKLHRSFCYKRPCDASPWNFGEKNWVALGFQAGICCEKASASALASVFFTTAPAFAQRINPVLSVFLFDSFVPTHLALRANLRLLLIRASLRRLTLRAALAVSRAAAQPPGSAHLPRCLVVYIRDGMKSCSNQRWASRND